MQFEEVTMLACSCFDTPLLELSLKCEVGRNPLSDRSVSMLPIWSFL